MIRVTSIRNIKPAEFDETWIIVRSLKHVVKGAIQVDALSPSLDLFFQYQRLVKEQRWGQSAFDVIYVPEFILGLMGNTPAVEKLNELYAKSKAGKRICVACFCPNEGLCHRSIIAGLLQGAGCEVETDSGADYSRYFDMYKNVVEARKRAGK